MNCNQANKNIDIFDLMERLGYVIQEKGSTVKEACYLSPWRPTEATGSFFIDRKTREYFDFGLGYGASSIIDFTLKYLESQGKNSNVSEALSFLKSLGYGGGDNQPSFIPKHQPPVQNSEEQKTLELIKVEDVHYSYIFDYLASRGISRQLVSKYLLQVTYHNRKLKKNFWGFATPNRSENSYEVRSTTKDGFKTALGKKDISIIRGTEQANHVKVFEGILDFLSLLAFQEKSSSEADIIILNSLALTGKSIEFINQEQYNTIDLYLDNDNAGREVCLRFKTELSEEVRDCSSVYQGYKDVNEALMAQIGKKQYFDFSL